MKIEAKFHLDQFFSIEWCGFYSKCPDTININDENILGPERNNFRYKRNYTLVQGTRNGPKWGLQVMKIAKSINKNPILT